MTDQFQFVEQVQGTLLYAFGYPVNADVKLRPVISITGRILSLFLFFPEGIGLFAVVAVAAAVAGLELQLLAFDADGGAGGNGMGDEHVGAYDTVPADDGTAA